MVEGWQGIGLGYPYALEFILFNGLISGRRGMKKDRARVLNDRCSIFFGYILISSLRTKLSKI